MEFLTASSGAHVASVGSGAVGQSSISFGSQEIGAAQFLGTADLLKQVEQLMAKAKTETLSEGKKLRISANQVRQDRQNCQPGYNSFVVLAAAACCGCLESLGQCYCTPDFGSFAKLSTKNT